MTTELIVDEQGKLDKSMDGQLVAICVRICYPGSKYSNIQIGNGKTILVNNEDLILASKGESE